MQQPFTDWDGFVQAVIQMLQHNRDRGVILLIDSHQGFTHFSNILDVGQQMDMLHRGYVATEENFRILIREQIQMSAQIAQAAINNNGGKPN